MKKLLLILPLVANVAFADCDNENGQVAYGNCVAKEYKQSQTQLNLAFAKAYKTSDIKKELTKAQDAWAKYKQAQCDAEMAQMGSGSGAGNTYYSCLTQLNTDRIKYLKDF